MSCFKCNGSGMKPCKNAQLHLRLPCPVCKGVGHLISKRNLNGKIYRPFKDLKSHIDPFYTSTLEAGVALTSLCRNWFIHQIQCGHRITSDDYVCAAFGCRHFLKSGLPRPKTYVDLGTGLGSVLMLVISGLDLNMDTVIHGVEIQERHVQLARQSLALNTLNATIFHSDLREFCPEITYDLITATPPYFPAASGSLPISANRAQCAFELNGDVSDYLALASKCLSKTSSARIVLANGGHVSRTINAGINYGLNCIERLDIHGRFGKDVLFSVYVFKWFDGEFVGEAVSSINIRDLNGEFSVDYQDLIELVLRRNWDGNGLIGIAS